MSLRLRLLRFLRIPPAPTAPSGDEEVHIFRAAPNFFRYRIVSWFLKNAAAVVGVLFGIGMLREVPGWLGDGIAVGPFVLSESSLMALLWLLEGAAILVFVLQAFWSLAMLRLDFEQRWYIVSDRSLRIREGLVRMHEKTMTFANIQHVTIRQGPLQRLLRIADLEVRTAGGGSRSEMESNKKKEDLHVAYFRGVADAEGISETIRERLRRHVDAGLGDPDDHVAPGAAGAQEAAIGSRAALRTAGRGVLLPADGAAALAEAARALAEEASALRVEVLRNMGDRLTPAGQ